MNTDFLTRIRRETAVTLDGALETIVSIADRSNRKIQVIKLHWQAATITRQVALTHQQAGSLLCEHLALQESTGPVTSFLESRTLQEKLEQLAGTIKLLKRDLANVDRRIAEIEAETLTDDLLKIQEDLSSRALRVERLTVVHSAAAIGRPLDQVALSPDTRILAAFRGPALLPSEIAGGLRQDDIVILLGRRDDLQRDRAVFSERQRATA